MRQCPCGCGVELRDEPARLRQEYASPACRERVRRARREAPRPPALPTGEQLTLGLRWLAEMHRKLGNHDQAERLDRAAAELD